MKVLLIDDTREESAPNIMRKVDLIARTYSMGIEALTKLGPWDLVLLDHDLNSYVEGKEYTGYDICCFLEANLEYLPKDIQLVSSNPPGRKRMSAVVSKLYDRSIL